MPSLSDRSILKDKVANGAFSVAGRRTSLNKELEKRREDVKAAKKTWEDARTKEREAAKALEAADEALGLTEFEELISTRPVEERNAFEKVFGEFLALPDDGSVEANKAIDNFSEEMEEKFSKALGEKDASNTRGDGVDEEG